MRFDIVDPGGLAVVRGKSPENRTRDDFDAHHCRTVERSADSYATTMLR